MGIKRSDLDALIDAFLPVIKEHVAVKTAKLDGRIRELEDTITVLKIKSGGRDTLS